MRCSFLIIVALLISIYSDIVYAQDQPKYHCASEQRIFYSDTLESYILACHLLNPVDERELRLFADEVYGKIKGNQYDELYMWWALVKNDNGKISIIDIGATHHKDGKLMDVMPPNVDQPPLFVLPNPDVNAKNHKDDVPGDIIMPNSK